MPADATSLHPSLLGDQECARVGGGSVPLPVSLIKPAVASLAPTLTFEVEMWPLCSSVKALFFLGRYKRIYKVQQDVCYREICEQIFPSKSRSKFYFFTKL